MSHLKVVPKTAPTPAEKVRLRIKAMPRPPGMLQCPRCGSRTIMTAKNGVLIVDGRKKHGTVIYEDICALCYQRGDIVPVNSAPKPIE